jgi:hypothetical protein
MATFTAESVGRVHARALPDELRNDVAGGADMTSGYSGTPLAKKLGIKEGHTVALLGAPEGFVDLLEGLPPMVELRTRAAGQLDVVVSFHVQRRDLERRVPAVLKAMRKDGGWWVAWPKRASGVATDITEDTVREVMLPLGLVDN